MGFGYSNHPCTRMWYGHINALKYYYNAVLREWIKRGYNNTMKFYELPKVIVFPSWFGDEELHLSHRASLCKKDPEYYIPLFGENKFIDYIWPIN